jgi:hypothetical protein
MKEKKIDLNISECVLSFNMGWQILVNFIPRWQGNYFLNKPFAHFRL